MKTVFIQFMFKLSFKSLNLNLDKHLFAGFEFELFFGWGRDVEMPFIS